MARSQRVFDVIVVGSWPLRRPKDPYEVVGSSAALHGLEGLQVADALIMPRPVRAGTHLTSLAIAERVAELLTQDLRVRFSATGLPSAIKPEVRRPARAAWRSRASAVHRDVEIEKGLAMGADTYVTKPFSTAELVTRVADMLEGGP